MQVKAFKMEACRCQKPLHKPGSELLEQLEFALLAAHGQELKEIGRSQSGKSQALGQWSLAAVRLELAEGVRIAIDSPHLWNTQRDL